MIGLTEPASTALDIWTELTRPEHARKSLRYSSELTDAERVVWESSASGVVP